MVLTVLNTEFLPIAILDNYESFIWTDRFRTNGDFELYTSMTDDILSYIKLGYYIENDLSEHAMIIEKIVIKTDIETGKHITVSGRSLESILDRRIVWGQRTLNGALQDTLETLLNECIINPSNSDRQIDNFKFSASTDDGIVNLTIDTQYIGDDLLKIVENACMEHGIGYKVIFEDTSSNSKNLVFQLYVGTDRSYDQDENGYVVFSPNFDNIINSNYIESDSSYKNVTLVGGEGDGSDRVYVTVGSGSGLDRREVFTDAKSISSKSDNTTLSESEYAALLTQKGNETLSEQIVVTSFEGETETTQMFKYGEDFFIGDIVQIADEYGHETKARIIEMVISHSEEGFSVYPTFETV